jgi:hypothetical protein
MWGDVNDQKNAPAIFQEMNARAVAALNEDKTVIYDATNLRADKRKATLQEIKRLVKGTLYAHCIVVLCSIEECKARQRKRDRKVPDEVIDRMVRQFQMPWHNEGWNEITTVECGPLYDLDAEFAKLNIPHDNPHHTLNIDEHCRAAKSKLFEMWHKMSVISYPDEVFKLAALGHDIGKGRTKDFHNAQGQPTEVAHYYDHQNVGAYLWLNSTVAHDIGVVSDYYSYLTGLLIQWHMQPYFLKEETEEETIKWFVKKGFTAEFGKAIWLLHLADRAAH